MNRCVHGFILFDIILNKLNFWYFINVQNTFKFSTNLDCNQGLSKTTFLMATLCENGLGNEKYSICYLGPGPLSLFPHISFAERTLPTPSEAMESTSPTLAS